MDSVQSSLDCKIKPVNPKGNQPWIFIGRPVAELRYFGHLMQWANCKRSGSWERLKAKGERGSEAKMVDSITDSNRHEFEQTLGDSEVHMGSERVRQNLATE